MKLRFLSIIALFSVFLSYTPTGSVLASGGHAPVAPATSAGQLLAKMTPEERVGQLFLVTFSGSTADENSQIHQLITNYHIGGAILVSGNDNFTAAPDTVTTAYTLISQLQTAEWQASLGQTSPTASESTLEAGTSPAPTVTAETILTSVPPNYVPLFIGISQDGDGYPNDQILSGLTPLPDLMALGATWNPALAEQVGSVAGLELSSIGFNLYLGPSLDVLESPQSTLGNGLGATSFGGDPYWVGTMGSAYIDGLHTGSQNRLLVIADHFPGRGSADRPAGDEPATVRKSLEQLKQIELAPFFSVTGNAASLESTADGLLVSHIRYQGFQGNIRATTRPVSFDPQALSQILSLPAFTSWRTNGGLLVSDDLGSQTVKSFYATSGSNFDGRLVARDAFLAGNDMLYMGNILSSDDPDNFNTVVNTIEFFDQKYLEDPAFAQRVDDACLRILTAKYRNYGVFDLATITPQEENLANLGQSQTVTFEVARQSATLVNPDIQDLSTVLPNPPVARDRIVFLTDTRNGTQCSTCGDEPMLAVDTLQNAVVRLYGSAAVGQVLASHLLSYTFTSLSAILDGGAGDPVLEAALSQTEWVVIDMLDAEPGSPQTALLRRFLSERQDLIRDKRVVVFAFGAPYYLDATDISKITAYYCLYSKSAPFVDMAARLLFQELSPKGSLPVSVAGIGYDLLTATSPDPTQVIGLSLDLTTEGTATDVVTQEITPTPSFKVGDTVTVRTSPIIDHNGHSVPDGTGVRFTVAPSGEGGVVQQIDAVTTQGEARISFSIQRSGLLEIRAESDPALTSVTLQMDVSSGGLGVTIVAPTPIGGPAPTVEPSATPAVKDVPPMQKGSPGFTGWLVMVILLVGSGSLFYYLGSYFFRAKWGFRWLLCTIAGGLLTYTYLAMGFPGAVPYLQRYGWTGLAIIVLLGAIMGWGAGYVWVLISESPKREG